MTYKDWNNTFSFRLSQQRRDAITRFHFLNENLQTNKIYFCCRGIKNLLLPNIAFSICQSQTFFGSFYFVLEVKSWKLFPFPLFSCRGSGAFWQIDGITTFTNWTQWYSSIQCVIFFHFSMLVTLYSSKPIAIFSRPQIVIRILQLPDFQKGTWIFTTNV